MLLVAERGDSGINRQVHSRAPGRAETFEVGRYTSVPLLPLLSREGRCVGPPSAAGEPA
jgi:hypothetical protein